MRIGLIVNADKHLDPWVSKISYQISKNFPSHELCLIESQTLQIDTASNIVLKMIAAIERYVLTRQIPVKVEDDNPAANTPHKIKIENHNDINSLNLDVIIDCIGRRSKSLSGLSARYGIWTLDFLLQKPNLIGFWESYKSAPVLKMKLLRYMDNPDRFELLSKAAINPKQSAVLNRTFMQEKAIFLIIKTLKALNIRDSLEIESVEASPNLSPPNILVALHYILKLLGRILKRIAGAFSSKLGARPEMYYLKFGVGDIAQFNTDKTISVYPNKNQYWADPFLYESKNELYVFFEVFDYKTQKGHIAVGQMKDDNFTFLGTAIDTPYHMSFPFLFENEGDLFMLPETHETKRIEIWRCVEFPLKWELHATALEGVSTADTILLKRDKAWWIFTNIANDIFEDHCSELHIFRSKDLSFEDLEPHDENPVVFDSRYARNAGRIFEVDGTLYRPAQMNAYGEYGYGLNVMEIQDLSLSHYLERQIKELSPEVGKYRGVHHFDSLRNRFVVDTRKRFGGWS